MTISRDITEQARKHLETEEILLFIGAKQAGKTTILKQLQAHLRSLNQQTFFLNLEDPDYLHLLNESPKNLFRLFPIDLQKRSFVFIDEVQYLADPSHVLKYLYDEYHDRMKLLVSGSSAFYIDRKFTDSLAGRKKIFPIHTLSFREFIRFKGEAILSQCEFSQATITEQETINQLYQEFLTYGGYPRVVLAETEEKQDLLREIAYSYIKKDIFEAHVRSDETFYRLFKILAAQVGNLVNTSELASTLDVSKTAIDHYVYVMQRSFHVRFVKPFARNIRKELTKMPKVYFYDLGLRNFFVNNFSPIDRRSDRGSLLENAVFRQLIDRYDEADVRFWRTTQRQEVDFVINDNAYEVKSDSRSFTDKKLKVFFEQYPSIQLQVVSLNVHQTSSKQYRVISPWEI